MTFILIFLFSFSSCSQTVEPADTSSDYVWNLEDSLAVSGYDTVAYFSLEEKDKAVKGKKEFSYEWEGAIWQFSSQENLDLFKAQPEKYIPEYGGYCAYAVARNYLYKIDPDAWTIKDGKLYLNANKSVRRSWLKDTDNEITKANKNWPRLKKQLKDDSL